MLGRVKDLQIETEKGVDGIKSLDNKVKEINSIVEMMKAGVNDKSVGAIHIMCDIVLRKLEEISYEDVFGLSRRLSDIRTGLVDIELEIQREEEELKIE